MKYRWISGGSIFKHSLDLTLPGLVLGELSGDVVEFSTVS